MQAEVIDVVENLRHGLFQYKAKRPAISWRAISQQSGVNRYFIKKLVEEDGTQAKKNLDFTQALMLAKFLSAKPSLKATIDGAEFPLKQSLKDAFNVIYSSEAFSNREMVKIDGEEVLNFDSFCILVLAHDRHGIPREHIPRILGERSLRALDFLLERGRVTLIEGDRIRLSKDTWLVVDKEVRHLHMINFIRRFFCTSNHGKTRNYSYIHVSRLKPASVARLQAMHEEFHRNVLEFMENEKNAGEVPFFSVACMDSMMDNFE